MVRDMLLFGYAAAIGFVAAGITASFYRMMTSEAARFGPADNSGPAWLSAFLLGALAGPIIIVRMAWNSVRDGRVSVGVLAIGAGVAGLWSGCIGILVLEVALSLRDSLA